MRILLTADPEIPVPPVLYGGIERIVDGLITELKSRGQHVGLVAHPGSVAAADVFFPWAGAVSQNSRDTWTNARFLRKAVRSFRPDVLHSFSRLAYMGPLLPFGLPKIMSYQREPSLRTTTWARRLSLRTLRFTGCSEYICRLGRRAGGEWNPIHNFVELNKFTFQPHVPDDAPLVFLSRVESIKGAHLAIEAARRARRRLIIAGNHADDGEHGRYWSEEILPHIGKDVEYVGPVDDVRKNELLGRAAAMLVPVQWDEPFGIVFAESLACGTPVISCPRGALPEIVRNGVEGYLAVSIDGLVEAIGSLSAIRRQSCRDRVETAFSQKVITDQYLDLYRRSTGGAGG